MTKKIKGKRKNSSDTKVTNEHDNVGKNAQKQKLKKKGHISKHFPPIVIKPNLKFKKGHKKDKLAKKIKQVHKNLHDGTVADLVDSGTTKVEDVKNKATNKATMFPIQKDNRQQHAKRKQQPNNKNKMKDQIPNKLENKANNSNQDSEEIRRPVLPKHKLKQNKKLDIKTAKINSLLETKLKEESSRSSNTSQDKNTKQKVNGHILDVRKLQDMLAVKQREKRKTENAKPLSLRERMMTKLRASRFRYLNETLYNNESAESKKYFKNDPDAFKAYHEGYKQQVEQWPLNPLDIIISSIKKMPKDYIVADFGCGEAKLAASVPHKVHSFDFVSLNENVTVCDMAHTPLLTNGIHIVVFCLSLMGTNLKDYIIEANRVLKKDGVLKIAEVESRFEQVEDFIKIMSNYGFKNTWKDLSHNLFYFLDFTKVADVNNKKGKLPPITLKPCLYKKR